MSSRVLAWIFSTDIVIDAMIDKIFCAFSYVGRYEKKNLGAREKAACCDTVMETEYFTGDRGRYLFELSRNERGYLSFCVRKVMSAAARGGSRCMRMRFALRRIRACSRKLPRPRAFRSPNHHVLLTCSKCKERLTRLICSHCDHAGRRMTEIMSEIMSEAML